MHLLYRTRNAENQKQMTSTTQPKCKLVTLGCKVNQYETQLVKEALLQNGYLEAHDDEVADLCIVNTCTVTSQGDSKSRQIIRKLSRDNPGTRTIVMGCYATRDPNEVAKLPNVFEVVTDKRELPDLFNRMGITDIPNGISYFDGRQRAFVKVQDGCILNCTYCIIPQVRPGLRSRSPQEIEEEIRRLIDNGHNEIVLTGIHVGHYGVETTRGKSGLPPFRLWHLFERLDRISGNWRMRLSSIETAEINDNFISAAANCEHLCPQFHPALQSGSTTVLRRMKRRYSVEKFLDKLSAMRERLDNPAFTTDVIVGFPGETEEEFQETMDACRKAEFMKIHIFPFSARKSTPAALFENQVQSSIIKERTGRLAKLENELATNFYRSNKGKEVEVLAERLVAEKPGWVRGCDRRYLPVQIPGTTADIGNFIIGRGIEATNESLIAERLSPPSE